MVVVAAPVGLISTDEDWRYPQELTQSVGVFQAEWYPTSVAHSRFEGGCPWPVRRHPQPIGLCPGNSPLSTKRNFFQSAGHLSCAYTLTLFSCRILYLVLKVPLDREIRRLRGNTVRLAIGPDKTGAAPATVSGERLFHFKSLSHEASGRRSGRHDPQARRPALNKTSTGGVPGRSRNVQRNDSALCCVLPRSAKKALE